MQGGHRTAGLRTLSVGVQIEGPPAVFLGRGLGFLCGSQPLPPMSRPVFQCFIKISAAYGSTKDISVYSVLGLPPSQIFIVGRPTKKYQTQCQGGGGGAEGWEGRGWGKQKGESGGGGLFPSLFIRSFVCSFLHLLIHSFNKHRWGPSLGQALHWVQGRPVVESDVISSNLGWEDGRISR